MAHWAKINDLGIVVDVVVADDDKHDWLVEQLGGTWLQTSYNTRGGQHKLGGIAYRYNYAGIGYTYDEQRDAFIPPKPSENATLDESTCTWIVPENDEVA